MDTLLKTVKQASVITKQENNSLPVNEMNVETSDEEEKKTPKKESEKNIEKDEKNEKEKEQKSVRATKDEAVNDKIHENLQKLAQAIKENRVKVSDRFTYEDRDQAPRDINLNVSEDNILPEGSRRAQADAVESKRTTLYEPVTYQEAVSCPDKARWIEAMNDELNSLKENNTWGNPVDLPFDRKAISSKWVFKIKVNALGKIEKYKARLVARGYTQIEGVDYTETFAPVARTDMLRILLADSLQKGFRITQMDVVTAYLYSNLNREIYMSQPEGFQSDNRHQVLLLKKGLYGLKQPAKLWNDCIKKSFINMGFQQCRHDPGLYVYNKDGVLAYALDDILLSTDSETLRKTIETSLSKEYKTKMSGEVKSVLGSHVQHDSGRRIDQSNYLQGKIETFGQELADEEDYPMQAGLQLKKEDRISDKEYPYREFVGSIMFSANTYRPDLLYSISYPALYSGSHNSTHWKHAMRLMRYIKGTVNDVLIYTR